MRTRLPAVVAACFASTVGACAGDDGGDDRPLLEPAPGSPVAVGRGSGSVALADVDRDGRPDLVTRHLLGRTVEVRFGDGLGGFAARDGRSNPLAYEPGAMALGDVDGDTVLDVVLAARDAGREFVDVLLGAGDGTFRRAAGAPIRGQPALASYKPVLRLADLDGDGDLDVVSTDGRRGTVEVLLGDGRGGFAPRRSLVVGSEGGLVSFEVADVDGGGRPDLVAATTPAQDIDRRPGTFGVRRGDGTGAFEEAARDAVTVLPRPNVESVADVDGDGRADVVLSHREDPRLSVLLQREGGGFAPAAGSPLDVGSEVQDVVVADADGDGRSDLVVAAVASRTAPYASLVTVLLGRPGGFVAAPGSPHPAGNGAYDVAVADVNGDGRPDVAASSFEGDAVTVLLGRR